MGRELKRIALDWSFPIGQTWTGYLNPHIAKRQKCLKCNGTGFSLGYRLLDAVWYRHGEARELLLTALAGHHALPRPLLRFVASEIQSDEGWFCRLDQRDVDALVKAGRLWLFTRAPINEAQREAVAQKIAAGGSSWLGEDNGHRPTAEEVNAWSRGFRHDSINAWICIDARAKRYGIGQLCGTCRGTGHTRDADLSRRIRAWRPTEPPAGEGYQIWQTVSEGGPVSPVCATPEALAHWMATNDRSDIDATTYDGWMRFILGPGWAPTAIIRDGRIFSGTALGGGAA